VRQAALPVLVRAYVPYAARLMHRREVGVWNLLLGYFPGWRLKVGAQSSPSSSSTPLTRSGQTAVASA
jgi:hypothetical protein